LSGDFNEKEEWKAEVFSWEKGMYVYVFEVRREWLIELEQNNSENEL